MHLVVYLGLREYCASGLQPGSQRLSHPLRLAEVAGQLKLEPVRPLDAVRGEIVPFQLHHLVEVVRVVLSLVPWWEASFGHIADEFGHFGVVLSLLWHSGSSRRVLKRSL